MENCKTLVEFLHALNELNEANINYLTGYETQNFIADQRFLEEFSLIKDLINSFEFVKNRKADSKLLIYPMPDEIKKVFGSSSKK